MSCADHLKLKVGLHKNMVLKVGLKLKHRLGLLEKYEAFVWLVSVLLNSGHGGFFANRHRQFVKGGPP